MRSLRNRLALLFALIVAAAIAAVYFSVTPQLEERLRDQKLEELGADAALHVAPVAEVAGRKAQAGELDGAVRMAAAAASAEVLVLGVARDAQESLFLKADSTRFSGVGLEDVQRVAQEAVDARRPQTGTEPTSVGRMALAARPVLARRRVGYVVVFADGLTDVQANVALIRRRILVSGVVALLLAVLAGYLVARALAARVKRLEQAARKVAGGDFSHPIVEHADDELGHLAAAFDDMQRQLAQLDRARKQFIASASHELRTPIFSLGGFLELMADEDLDEETRAQFLAQVRGQVERLHTLATELLDLSRLESGALELRPEPTDLGQLAREVAREFTPALARRGARLNLVVKGEPIEAECDPERVAQVVRILLDNAVVHTPAGTPIVVSAARENGHVVVEVSDRGLGIKRHNLPHIFEPFFTSDDQAQGAGLGLAIARELADRMRGELTVRSSPGATTFSLVLPA